MWKLAERKGSRPVSLEQAKVWLRVDDDIEDDLVLSAIDAAVETVEKYTSRLLIPSTIKENFDRFAYRMHLRWPPTSITSVTYIDENEAEQNLEGFVPSVGNAYKEMRITTDTTFPSIGDTPYPITVTYESGYDDVPAPLLTAVKLILGKIYENRSDERELQQVSTVIPTTAEYYMDLYAIRRF